MLLLTRLCLLLLLPSFQSFIFPTSSPRPASRPFLLSSSTNPAPLDLAPLSEETILATTTLAELKSLCVKMKIPTSGTKQQLLTRIKLHSDAVASVLYNEPAHTAPVKTPEAPPNSIAYSTTNENDMTITQRTASSTTSQAPPAFTPPPQLAHHTDLLTDLISTILPPTPSTPFNAELVPQKALHDALPSLLYDGGKAMEAAIRTHEVDAVGQDGPTAPDDASKGGGHYNMLTSVASFLRSYRTSQSESQSRSTTASLIAAATNNQLDNTLAALSSSNQLNEDLLKFIKASVTSAEQQTPGSNTVAILKLLHDRVKAELIYGQTSPATDPYRNDNLKLLARAMQTPSPTVRESIIRSSLRTVYEQAESFEELCREAFEYAKVTGALTPSGLNPTLLGEILNLAVVVKTELLPDSANNNNA